jgi:3-hydroxyacyl-[acyl-carrier-protein] dehydratase
MPPELQFDLSTIDLSQVIADKEEIRKHNPQRFEMEHLDGIIYVDPSSNLIIGYKDVRPDEFWVRGHIPGFPLLPGVIMCEAAAQLCSFYIMRYSPIEADFIGFGGMEDVRFRRTVKPGERLILVGKANKLHRRQTLFTVQGMVDGVMVFHGDIIGVAMQQLKPEA